MSMSDPIADMLTRIRNANTARHNSVLIPSSKMKVSIANILKTEGYIENYELIDNGKFKDIKITLKYKDNKRTRILSGIKKISKPGLRQYSGKEDLPQVLNGLGIAIVSTNEGVMTDKEARKRGIGCELICYVW